MKVKIVVVLISLLVASSVMAGPAEELSKLDFLLGEWKGEGSMRRGPGEPTVSFVHEKVRKHAGGTVIAIQGRGNLKLDDGAAGALVHDAYGTIWWDKAAGRYRFFAFTAEQGHVDAHFALTGDKAARWGFETAQGQIRYSIRLTEKGEWNEVGEFSRDGDQWVKFFEMTLTKVPE